MRGTANTSILSVVNRWRDTAGQTGWTNRFVEHGFLDGNYYGTSIDSIRNVINSGKTLLTLLPQVSEIGDDVMLM